MRRNCLILTIFVAASACLLQIGPQKQALGAEESKLKLTAPEPATLPAKAETAPEANEPAPKITVEEAVHDFGDIGPGTKNVCEFKFTNTGDGLLKIERIKSTCGCTVPKLTKKEYAPGESGTVKVTYKVGKRSGPTAKHLYIHSNDKERPKVGLTIKARIVKKVFSKPEKLNLSLKEENAGCPEITLSSLDNKPFSIKRFKSTPNCITADYDSSVEATKFVLQPKVDMVELRKSLKGQIDISLTHPECDTVTIGFNVLPEFKITPSSLIIFKAEPQKPIKKEVWILNNYNEDFEVESASSQKNIIKISSQEKVGNRYKFELEITPPAPKGKQKSFSDVFFVNIKGGEKLRITCRGFYSKVPKRNKERLVPPRKVKKPSIPYKN